MNTKQPAAHRAESRSSSRLVRGMAVAWFGIVASVAACTLVGLNWNFQRNTNGLPTEVLGARTTPTQPVTLQPQTVSAPTALPTAMQAATPLPGAATSGSNATLPPNQATAFGYGIESRLKVNSSTLLDHVQALGLGWIKYQVRWSQVEPDPGQYQWNELDAVVQAASRRGLNILLTVGDAPSWARSATAKGKSGPPDNVQSYVNIITLILQRYGNAVHAIELWDEENVDQSWYAPGGLSPSSYLNLLIPTAQAVRQIDPGVIIISGALRPTGKNDGISAVDDFNYLQALIEGKLLDYVDCVGVHHFGFNLPPTLSAEDAFSGGMPAGTIFAGPYDTSNPVNPHHSWSFYSTLNGYHNLIVAAGHETPLCVTEFGWASAEDIGTPPPDFLFALDNTQDEQAKYIVRAFRVMHDWGFVRLAILYNLDGASTATADQPVGGALFSILGPDSLPRPAYLALRDMPKLP
jgi:hypothetical protein